MQTVLIVFHLMVVIALVATVLLQRSEGGALGVGGGGGFMTGRGQANALTRATAILGALFFVTSLALTLLANFSHGPKSIIDAAPGAAPTQTSEPATAPGATPVERLRQLDQPKPASGIPAESAAPPQPQTPALPAQPEVPKSQ